jgi:hypothetical protein
MSAMKMFERESADNVERPVRERDAIRGDRAGRGARGASRKNPRVQAHGTQNTVYLKIRLCIYMYLLGL